jgi:hypothetical protein
MYSNFYLRIRKGVQVNGAADEAALFAAELLALRSERRRLRKALKAVVHEHQHDCCCVACSALHPPRETRRKKA